MAVWKGVVCAAAWTAVNLAATLCGAQDADPQLVQMVVELIRDPDREMRSLAFEQVRSDAPGEAATRQFAAQLASLGADEQVGLLQALAARGDGAARTSIVELLESSTNGPVRNAAIQTLGALGDATDVPQLAQLLTKASSEEQAAARKSLVQLRGEGPDLAIIELARTSQPETRAAMIEVLAERRTLDALPDLQEAAVSESAVVRTAAMQALQRLAGGDVARTVMVGDSSTDVKTAKAANIPVIAVDFGYTDIPVEQLGADRIISHYDELWDAVHALTGKAGW